MFRAVCRSSLGAPTLFAASGLHTHVVTGRSQVWVGSHSDLTIINSVTRLHIVGYFHWVILRCTDPWILNLQNKSHIFGLAEKRNCF